MGMYDEDDVEVDFEKRATTSWVSDTDLQALGLERATGLKSPDGAPESHVAQARRMIREAAPMAASTMIRLAQYGENETVRLRAATEILNRAEAQGATDDGREPWAEVYDSIMTDMGDQAERHANGE